MEKKNISPNPKDSPQKPGSDLLDKFREPALAQDNLPDDQRSSLAYYGLAQQGERVAIVEFVLRTGRIFFLHYAYRFNIDLQTNGKLVLLANSAQIKITISGRGLDRLARYLVLAQVKWIKESTSPLFDDSSAIFVAGIDISGKGVE